MTVTSLLTKVTAAGNGVATSFSFSPVIVFAASDLVVTHVDADGIETVLDLGTGATNYSVTVPSFPGTGSITYPADTVTPLPTGESLVIQRVLPLTQATSLTNQGPYLPKVQENQFDRLVMIAQQLKAAIDLCVDLPALGFTDLAGAVPRVNATEDGFEWKTGLTGSDGAVGADGPAGPPGPVIQHVHSRDDTTRTTTSDTYVTATAAVSITPTSASNRVRIRVMTTAAHSHASGAVYLTLYRGGVTDLTPAGRDGMAFHVNGANSPTSICFEFVDSPASAAEVTYNLFFRENGQGTAAIGGRSSDGAFDGITMMVAEEILADGTLLTYPIPIDAFAPGEPTASQKILRYVATEAFTIAADFSGSKADAGIAATAETVFSITVNGSSGPTLTFAAAGTTGTFDSSAVAVDIAVGDVIQVTAPATPDATLADISINIRGLAPVS